MHFQAHFHRGTALSYLRQELVDFPAGSRRIWMLFYSTAMQCKQGFPARRKLKRRKMVLLDLANQKFAA